MGDVNTISLFFRFKIFLNILFLKCDLGGEKKSTCQSTEAQKKCVWGKILTSKYK